MKRTSFVLPDRVYAIPFTIAAFIIVFIYSKHGGIGVSPDSIVYLSAARNFIEKGALLGYNQLPVVDFPFFYPLFLAAVKLFTHTDPVIAGPYINGVMFAIVVYLSSTIIDRFVNHSLIYRIIILACIIVAPCLQEVYSMLWSETLFIIFSLLLIIALYRYFKTYTLRSLFVVAFIVAFSCVTRYAGIAYVGAVGALLLLDKNLLPKKKTLHIAVFGFLSISLLVLNLYRNWYTIGFLMGNREKGITPLADNISYFGSVIGNWLPFFPNQNTISFIVGCIVLLALLIACFIYWMTNSKWHGSYENIATVFSLIYALFIVLSSTVSHYEKINDRLLSPLYIPLLISFTCRIPALIQLEKQKVIRYTSIVVSVIIAIGFFYRQYQNDKEFYEDVSTYGIPGFTDDSWTHSQTINFIQKNKSFFNPDYCIYSNAPEAIYFNCGLVGENLPNNKFPDDVNKFYTKDHYYIVWFNNKEETPLPLDEIKKHKVLRPLVTFSDGAVYIFEQ